MRKALLKLVTNAFFTFFLVDGDEILLGIKSVLGITFS